MFLFAYFCSNYFKNYQINVYLLSISMAKTKDEAAMDVQRLQNGHIGDRKTPTYTKQEGKGGRLYTCKAGIRQYTDDSVTKTMALVNNKHRRRVTYKAELKSTYKVPENWKPV